MTRCSRIVISSAVVALVSVGSNAVAQTVRPGAGKIGAPSTVAYGHILGVVTDGAGVPLDGATVSAVGPSGTVLGIADAEGRFEFRWLEPGAYLLRAHVPGFLDGRRHLVEVAPGARAHEALTLHRGMDPAPLAPAFLAAGFGGDLTAEVGAEPVTAAETDESDRDALTPHDHSEKAYWLRRARRSVLKEARFVATATDDTWVFGQPVSFLSRAVGSSSRLAATFFGETPLSGELHLLMRGTMDQPSELLSSDYWPGQIAYLTVGAPVAHGHWSVQGAVTTGDARSWVLSGGYAGSPKPRHDVNLGLSYSVQRHRSDADVVTAFRTTRDDNNRNVGSFSIFDTWTAAPRLTVGYGGIYSRYDYLAESGLFSPRLEVSVVPLDSTRVRVGLARSMVAPGAEEFLPPAATGIWLPPERTFAPLTASDPLRVERARWLEIAVDHDLSEAYVISLKRFYHDVANQLVTVFDLASSPAGRGHYYLASAGAVDADGWGVGVSRDLAGRWRGAVDYSITNARWPLPASAEVTRYVPSAARAAAERFHDVTTSVETDIPETATHVIVVYRLNTAFARSASEARTPGVDGRFDLRVKQMLPFSPVEGSRWEILVAVRSLFRDAWDGASPYDELFVVSPPKQFVGGLVVNF